MLLNGANQWMLPFFSDNIAGRAIKFILLTVLQNKEWRQRRILRVVAGCIFFLSTRARAKVKYQKHVLRKSCTWRGNLCNIIDNNWIFSAATTQHHTFITTVYIMPIWLNTNELISQNYFNGTTHNSQYLSAYLSVFNVCSQQLRLGDIMAICKANKKLK
jgi:hypothetical protein